jgi:hypothetical protein
MRLYAEIPARRARQVAFDIGAVVWVLGWIWVAVRIHDLVGTLSGPLGEALKGAGSAISDIGGLFGFGGAGNSVAGAGDIVSQLSWYVVPVALLPLAAVLFWYIPRRVRWGREAAAAAALRGTPGDTRLFAMRALTHQPLARLQARVADPIGSYSRGEFDELAAVELTALGLHSRPSSR